MFRGRKARGQNLLISCFGGAVLYCCSAVLTRRPDEVRCPQQLFDTRCAGGNRLVTTSETRFGAMMQQHRVSPAKYRSTSCPAYGSLALFAKNDLQQSVYCTTTITSHQQTPASELFARGVPAPPTLEHRAPEQARRAAPHTPRSPPLWLLDPPPASSSR